MPENLNPQQQQAVHTTDGAVLVIAGAGTGKTHVLISRIMYILNSGLAQPYQILALTFTNKAANEMKSRLSTLSDGRWNAGDIWCGTFHSVCLRILRRNASRIGLRSDFLIYGEDDQKSVIKSLLTASTKTPAEYVEEFSLIKDRGTSAFTNRDKLFNAYNAELARLNALDFGDIILKTIDLFDKNPDILSYYQNKFKYILVDEFQDTNTAQMELLLRLTHGIQKPNICCVGDDDQSIYSWRGAEIKNILGFQKTYSDVTVIRLETNYRSTGNILGAANSLIAHNSDRLGKNLSPYDSDMGEPVYVLTVPTDRDEARIIADAILRDTSGDFSKYAILIRAGSLSRVMEEEFGLRGIPYRVIGATKFYDRMEIRDVIAYLRLLVYPFDDISFMRVIGKPKRGFGPKALENLRASGENLMSALRVAKLSPKMRSVADEFLSAFDFDWASMSPVDAAKRLLNDTGYMRMWSESKDADAPERLVHIRELLTTMSDSATLPEFLEKVALMTTDDDDGADTTQNNYVRIMTIHAAKGLEFDTVFLPAWEQGIFPNEKSAGQDLAEERRLAYVAITRARKRCVILNAISRFMYGSRTYNAPSIFISELDRRYTDVSGSIPVSYASYTAPSSSVSPVPRRTSPRTTMVGKLVTHSELGSGVVIEDKGEILTVAFKNCGIKNVARQYVY